MLEYNGWYMTVRVLMKFEVKTLLAWWCFVSIANVFKVYNKTKRVREKNIKMIDTISREGRKMIDTTPK